MRVAFFGLPLAAVLLARDGHTIAYAGVSRTSVGLRRLASRVAPGRTYVRPGVDGPSVLAAVRNARPDLLVSWFWTTKLPADLLALAPSVGVHPSLLPRHRGPDPYFWTLDEGDAVAGVTAHALEPEYDTGPILGRRELAVDPTWNAWQLARALDRPSLALLRQVVGAYAAGRLPKPEPQDERGATLAPEPSDELLELPWSWPAARIERRVRAAAPWPGAWTQIGNEIVSLLEVRVTEDVPRALHPGEAAVRSDGVAVVRAADQGVALLAGRRDADDTALSAADLAAVVQAAREA